MSNLIEFKVLSNYERRYFGLDETDPTWERYEIKSGYIVYFDAILSLSV